ncbi:MAG TPA: lactate utilization protein [Nitrososphaerales archaeon]|nr:lactate utilization protein [Nitrososphaerales archaeon]
MTQTAFSQDFQNPVEEFSVRFSKQAGVIYPAKSPEDVVAIVNGLIKSRGKGESCCSSEIQITANGSLRGISSQIDTTVAYEDFQKNPRKIAALLDVGITKAEYGIAETGTIVDISYTDEHRLLSSLSRVHIAVLERTCILEKLSMLSPRMKELLLPGVEPKPSITFIGGPSRTSDIELKSVLGVHGPHEVHVVLI